MKIHIHLLGYNKITDGLEDKVWSFAEKLGFECSLLSDNTLVYIDLEWEDSLVDLKKLHTLANEIF